MIKIIKNNFFKNPFVFGWVMSVLVAVVIWYLVKGFHIYDYRLAMDEKKDSNNYLESWDGDLSSVDLVEVGGEVIKMADLDFEHKLITQVLDFDQQKLQPLFTDQNQNQTLRAMSWKNLRLFLLRAIIKRKLLYQMVLKDQNYDAGTFENNNCASSFNEVISNNVDFFAKHQQYKKLLKDKLCENTVIDQYVKDIITKDVKVTELEAKKYYLNNRLKFLKSKIIRLRHIHLADERSAKRVRYKANKKNFSQLAIKYSIAPEAKQGGLLPELALDQAPVFLKKSFLLPLYKVSPIIKSPYGYHIVLPLKKYPERVQEFSEIKDQISKILLDQKRQDLFLNWVLQALNTVPVKSLSYMLNGGQI